MILEDSDKIISANMWGKVKTVTQMLTLIFILITQSFPGFFNFLIFTIFQDVLVWASAILSLVSGAIYILKNYKYIKVD